MDRHEKLQKLHNDYTMAKLDLQIVEDKYAEAKKRCKEISASIDEIIVEIINEES